MRWLILLLFPVIGSAAIHSGPTPSTTDQLPPIADGTILGNTSGSTAAPSALSILPSGLSTVTPGVLTGQFYLPNGAKIWNLTDRVMVGSAALGNGQFLTYSGLPAWVAATYLFRDSQLGSINTTGMWGSTAASRTSDAPTGETTGALGAYMVNDYAGTGSPVGRAQYSEIQHSTSSASAQSVIMEAVLKNTGGTNYAVTPYGGSGFGPSGFSMACGGDPSYGGTANANCNYALFVNQSVGASVTFNKGIVFGRLALTGADGTSGGGNSGQALEMGYGQGIRWISSNGTPQAGRISSVGTASTDQSIDMQFQNNAVRFLNNSSSYSFGLSHVASGLNYLLATDAVAGSSPILSPIAGPGSSDTNLDINLTPLGTGSVKTPSLNITGGFSAAFGTTGVGLLSTSATQTDSTTGAGTVTSAYYHNISPPTFATAGNAITITNAYTLDIAGCPNQGSNVTITNCGGLRVGGGIVQINGQLNASGNLAANGTVTANVSNGANVTNIGTGTTTGAVTIGGGSDAVIINSSSAGSIKDTGLISTGTKFTAAGTGCTVGTTTGGATAGTFALAAGPCTSVAITMNGATGLTSNTGWTCQAHDKTAPTVLIGGESSSTTTTATITIPAGAGATDVISFSCAGY